MAYVKDILARQKALAEAPTLGNLHPDARAQAIARAGIADAEAMRKRMEFLHSAASVDADGYEWGVFRVKWENGRAVDVQRVRADHSDLDAAIGGVPVAPAACAWSRDGDDESDLWHTGCGQYFRLDEGTPTDNKMHFCYSCGKPIDELPWDDGEPDAAAGVKPTRVREADEPLPPDVLVSGSAPDSGYARGELKPCTRGVKVAAPERDYCTDPDNCKRCGAATWDQLNHHHAGIPIGTQRTAGAALPATVESREDAANVSSGAYHLDTVCATCGERWGRHVGKLCDDDSETDRRFVPTSGVSVPPPSVPDQEQT